MANPAWKGIYARAGRQYVLGQAKLPTSKATGLIFIDALFGPTAASGSTGTVAKTDIPDTAAGNGTTTILATLSRTNTNDGRTISGTTTVVGVITISNINDSLAATGSVGSAASGDVVSTNTPDGCFASGTPEISGPVTRTNGNDSAAIVGAITVFGDVNTNNSADTMVGIGTVGPASGSEQLWNKLTVVIRNSL